MAAENTSETTTGDSASFEAEMARLEQLVASLEGGELGLEESVKAYEDGLKLARSCLDRLDKAELRVQQLSDVLRESDGRNGASD